MSFLFSTDCATKNLHWARADSKESADFESLAFVESNMEKSTARTIFLDIWNNDGGRGIKGISKTKGGLLEFFGVGLTIQLRCSKDWRCL